MVTSGRAIKSASYKEYATFGNGDVNGDCKSTRRTRMVVEENYKENATLENGDVSGGDTQQDDQTLWTTLNFVGT